jgi:YD repeat-containing protein
MFSGRQIVAVSLVLMLIAATFGCSREGAVAQKRAEQIQQDGDGACCAGHDSQDLKTPELLVTLPTEHVNTPDAMCLLPDGNLILTVPNFNNLEQQPLLMKITPENQAEVFYMLPDHPETGEPFGSLGVWPAPDGDLFVCDYQMTADGMGRVVRILVEDGRAVGSRPVITGFNIPNGLITRGEHLYVADTQLDASQTPVISGVFRFALADLEGDEPVKLAENLLEDTHLLGTIETHDETLPLGADGLCFDKAGNLYVSNFADGTVHRFEFDDDGRRDQQHHLRPGRIHEERRRDGDGPGDGRDLRGRLASQRGPDGLPRRHCQDAGPKRRHGRSRWQSGPALRSPVARP